MTKFLLLTFTIASFAVSVSSCVKARTCECKDSNGTAQSFEMVATKKDAKTACSAYNSSGYSSCELK